MLGMLCKKLSLKLLQARDYQFLCVMGRKWYVALLFCGNGNGVSFVLKVKITKEGTDGESESDVEIDIVDDEQKRVKYHFAEKSETKVPDEQFFNITECDEATMAQLTSLEKPNEELIMDPANISQLEKVVHGDFFEGRAAKTPSRYLKVIRDINKD